MIVCLFVPHAFLYDASECDETLVSCYKQAREGFYVSTNILQ